VLGVLLIDKPQGITSHDVVNRLRRTFSTKRVGHAGTLDPLGTGLLVIAIGPATRFLQYLPLEPKEYVCDFAFGAETNTQDSDGEIVAERPVPDDLALRLRETIPQFLGLIDQLPPMYSAIKKDGKPLYAYARKGEEVERDKRTIHIDEIEIVAVSDNVATLRVVCSGGTYMRTLGHDIGMALGCGAHMTALRRTRAGAFRLQDATILDDVDSSRLMPLRTALGPMPILTLDERQEADIRQGRRVRFGETPEVRWVGLLGSLDDVFGVARVEDGDLQPECVIPIEAPRD